MRRFSPLLLIALVALLAALMAAPVHAVALGAAKNVAMTPATGFSSVKVPINTSTQIWRGAIVVLDTDGYARAAADTTSFRFIGIALESVNNTGADGAASVWVRTSGEFTAVTAGLTQADVGKTAYASDDQTVALTATNYVRVGTVTRYISATSCRVLINPGNEQREQHYYTAWPLYTIVTDATDTRVMTSADYGKIISLTHADAVTVTLPANGAAAGSWTIVAWNGDDSLAATVATATADTLITFNDTAADSVTFGAGHRKGAMVLFWSDGTYWHAQNMSSCTMTVNT